MKKAAGLAGLWPRTLGDPRAPKDLQLGKMQMDKSAKLENTRLCQA